MKQGAGEERKSPFQAPCPHPLQTHLEGRPPHTHLCPQTPALPTTAAPAAESAAPSQRSAAQPSRRARRPGQCRPPEEGQQPTLPAGSAAAVAAAAVAPGGAASASDLGYHPRGRGGRVAGTAAGGKGKKGVVIPVARFKEMEEGKTSYPMAREDRETAVTEGGGGSGGPRGLRRLWGRQGECLHQERSGGRGEGAWLHLPGGQWSCQDREHTHLKRKGWGQAPSQRRGVGWRLCSGPRG